MDVPGTLLQLLVLLFFIVPGFVYQAVRQRVRGPNQDDINFSNKLFRAFGVGAGLMAVYLAVAGHWLLRLTEIHHQNKPSWEGVEHNLVSLAWLSVLLFLVIPAALPTVGYFWTTRTFSFRSLTYSPVPRAWDYTFTDIEPCYVRVLTTDGSWLGGWFGSRSFISSFPEPREMFIESAYMMQPDGSFGLEQPWSAGIYIRCDDVRAVELLRPPPSPPPPSAE